MSRRGSKTNKLAIFAEGGKMGKIMVLVAEDNEDVRTMMTYLLKTYGYEVIEASDGYEAVEMAVKAKPDLILMDIAMPVLDGVQAVLAIRQHEDLVKVPIVALTAFGDYYAEKALEAGCNDVIQKPLDFEHLRPLLQRYVS